MRSHITSKDNSRIKRLRALAARSSEREKGQLFVAEGLRLVSEIPQELIDKIYVSESAEREGPVAELLEGAERAGIEILVIPDDLMKSVSDTVSPQGIMAIVHMPVWEMKALSGSGEMLPLVLFLEDIRDPGNMGTIIRTAEGAGVSGIITGSGCTDIFSPKVIRSTMGSIIRMPLIRGASLSEAIDILRELGCTIYGAYLDGSEVYDRFNYCEPTAFMIGNEAHGLSKEAALACDKLIRIPMSGKLESLNAAMAAGILSYEAGRQRRS